MFRGGSDVLEGAQARAALHAGSWAALTLGAQGHMLYDCSAEFRMTWLRAKLGEETDAHLRGPHNPYCFQARLLRTPWPLHAP